MVQIRAFRALRPDPAFAQKIVSVPYDVVDRNEARQMAADNPMSWLRVVRSDLEFPDSVDQYSPEIYARAKENLLKYQREKWMVREERDALYVYRQNRGSHQQTGLVALSAVDDYLNDTIKKHEFTRKDKEKDRTTHIDVLGANTGPVFLLYRSREQPDIARLLDAHADAHQPLFDCAFDDGVRHRLYPVPPGDLQNQLRELFGRLNATYIADGHHRAASAVSVARARREQAAAANKATGDELFNFFLSVIFPDDQLAILPYNRAVKDLNGLSPADFLEKIKTNFSVRDGQQANPGPYDANLYMGGKWYTLTAKPQTYQNADEIDSLAVSILQNHLLAPVLDIADPRTSERISFIGGIRGDAELVKLVDSGRYAAAFSMPPVTTTQLIRVADAGKVMPPKSTWFEPKLRSGFLVHLIDG